MVDHQEIWCQPADQTKRQFLVLFDDPQMDLAVFDNEEEARAFWEKANLNWTCYLMGTMPRSPSPETREAALSNPQSKAVEPVAVWTCRNNAENLNASGGFGREKFDVVWDFTTRNWASADTLLHLLPAAPDQADGGRG